MDFIAIDFETSNHKSAPCSIGVVEVKNNEIVNEYYSLINPEQSFSSNCVRIHGITTKDVVDSPTFPVVWEQIRHYFSRLPVVAHSAGFDKSVLEKTAHRYNIDLLPIVTMIRWQYISITKVLKRIWD